MSKLIIKRFAAGLALTGALLSIGCGKSGGGNNNDIYGNAQSAFNNCLNITAPYNAQGACYQVRGYYACSVNDFMSGMCGYNYQNVPPQGYYNQSQMLAAYFNYLRQARIPDQDINNMIAAWNRGGY